MVYRDTSAWFKWTALVIVLALGVAAVLFYQPTLLSRLKGSALDVLNSDPDLLAYWKFDETSGVTAAAIVPAGAPSRDATLVGASFVSGKFGNAVSFDGANNHYLTVPGTIGGWPEITMAAWVKGKGTTSNAQLIFGGESKIALGGGGFVGISAQNSSGGSVWIPFPAVSQTPLNEYRHVAITSKSGETVLYVNGVEVGRSTQTFANIYPYNLLFGAQHMDLGGGVIGKGFVLNGELDDAYIFKRALLASEIATLAQQGVAASATPPTPIAHWKFDETSGTQVIDSIGTSPGTYPGTLNGPTRISDGKLGSAIRFGGNALQFVEVNEPFQSLKNSSTFSISLWVKLASGQKQDFQFLGSGMAGCSTASMQITRTGISLSWYGKDASDLIQGAYSQGFTSSSYASQVQNGWMHVVSTWGLNGTILIREIYVNGSMLVPQTLGGPIDPSDGLGSVFVPGKLFTNCNDFMVFGANASTDISGGDLDDVQVFNKSLSVAEVQQIYNAAAPPPLCNNGIDDDHDGMIDLSDPGCTGVDDTTEAPNPQCSDGVDNDNDGKKDYGSAPENDAGCTSLTDDDERDSTQTACANANGTWENFSNGCVDSCAKIADPDTVCTEATTYSCECGPSKCWNGSACVDNPAPPPPPDPICGDNKVEGNPKCDDGGPVPRLRIDGPKTVQKGVKAVYNFRLDLPYHIDNVLKKLAGGEKIRIQIQNDVQQPLQLVTGIRRGFCGLTPGIPDDLVIAEFMLQSGSVCEGQIEITFTESTKLKLKIISPSLSMPGLLSWLQPSIDLVQFSSPEIAVTVEPPSSGGSVCGNKRVETGEACDGATGFYECSSDTCQISWPTELCPNGLLAKQEYCDDGNTASGDGCSSICQIENTVMFVTEKIYAGELGGISGANEKCQAAAFHGDLPAQTGIKTWKALISDDTQDIITAWMPNSILRLDGKVIAQDQASLFLGGDLKNPLNLTERLYMITDIQPSAGVWTGSKAEGTVAANFCKKPIPPETTSKGTAGLATAINGNWLSANPELSCNVQASLYCYGSGVFNGLTAPTTPLPPPPQPVGCPKPATVECKAGETPQPISVPKGCLTVYSCRPSQCAPVKPPGFCGPDEDPAIIEDPCGDQKSCIPPPVDYGDLPVKDLIALPGDVVALAKALDEDLFLKAELNAKEMINLEFTDLMFPREVFGPPVPSVKKTTLEEKKPEQLGKDATFKPEKSGNFEFQAHATFKDAKGYIKERFGIFKITVLANFDLKLSCGAVKSDTKQSHCEFSLPSQVIGGKFTLEIPMAKLAAVSNLKKMESTPQISTFIKLAVAGRLEKSDFVIHVEFEDISRKAFSVVSHYPLFQFDVEFKDLPKSTELPVTIPVKIRKDAELNAAP